MDALILYQPFSDWIHTVAFVLFQDAPGKTGEGSEPPVSSTFLHAHAPAVLLYMELVYQRKRSDRGGRRAFSKTTVKPTLTNFADILVRYPEKMEGRTLL